MQVSYEDERLHRANLKGGRAPSSSKSPPRSSNEVFPPVTAPRTNNSQELNNAAKVVSPETEEGNNETKNNQMARPTSPMYPPLRPPTKGKHFY